MLTFGECLRHTGIELAPELEQFYLEFCENPDSEPLLDRAYLEELTVRFDLDEAVRSRMNEALNEIEEDDVLRWFSRFLVRDMCAARHRCDLDDYRAMTPTCMKNADLYSFLLLIACVPRSIRRLEELKVPSWFYRDIPYIPMARQFEKLKKTGDGSVSDCPWDMNFYTCSIFRLDRFNFIPYRLDENIRVYRSRETGEVVAFYAEEMTVRRDGQINGVNDISDANAYSVTFSDADGKIVGTPVSPAGLFETKPVELDAAQWELVLQKGDILLGTHIPGGPGYEPARLKSSIQWAGDFFDRYFPEIPIKGFGSESWLYDPHLRLLLKENSNILRMQDQMYIYPIESGGDMMFRELFLGNENPTEADCKTSLQRSALERLRQGKQFTACSMFILREDVDRVGGLVYGTAAHREDAINRMNAYDGNP